MDIEELKPAKFTKDQIKEVAGLFAKHVDYAPQKKNLRACVENIGGEITIDDTKIDSIGGSITVRGKNNFTIYLSSFTSQKRDNFTIAHELGHYVLHSKLGTTPINANRDDSSKSLVEREANCFAAEFLMPEKDLRQSFSTNSSLIHLAEEYNVSLSAMKWRCHNLKLI